MATMNDALDDDFDYDPLDDDDVCEGCGKPNGEGHCPMCCPYDGWYAPGTEECDFCEYSDECIEAQNAVLKKRNGKKMRKGKKDEPKE